MKSIRPSQQLRQLGDVRRDPPRLIAIGWCSPLICAKLALGLSMRQYAKLLATASSLILVAMAGTAFGGPIEFFQGVYHDFFGSSSPCPSDPSAFWNYCQGTFTDPRGGGKYVGEWKDNRKNGQGTETWPDGYKYVGEWRDNFKNGRGTLTFPNGDKYMGEFKDDHFDGT